jgi:cell division protein FtsB
MSTEKSVRHRLFRIIVILIGLVLVINLSRNILKLLKAGDRISLAERKLAELEKKNQQLAEQKEYYQSEDFVEQEARNKLNMARPGEAIVILPPNVKELLGKTESKSTSGSANWEMWWKLFF